MAKLPKFLSTSLKLEKLEIKKLRSFAHSLGDWLLSISLEELPPRWVMKLVERLDIMWACSARRPKE